MMQDNLKIAYTIVDNFNKYDTSSNPPRINTLDYKVPKISGIHYGEHHKNIEEVKPNTLEYILYRLHSVDVTLATDTLIAFLYYWKFRKKKQSKMIEVFNDVVNHYTTINKPYIKYENSKVGNCIYLVKIYIGSKILHKVGITQDIHQRMTNLQSDINIMYPLVSVGIDVLEVNYCNNNEELEQLILKNVRQKKIKKHKFFFDGHTESFESEILIDIFKQYS